MLSFDLEPYFTTLYFGFPKNQAPNIDFSAPSNTHTHTHTGGRLRVAEAEAMASKTRVAIVGSGIGGLVLAKTLTQYGADTVEVCSWKLGFSETRIFFSGLVVKN